MFRGFRAYFSLPVYEYVATGLFCGVLVLLSSISMDQMAEPVFDGNLYTVKKFITITVKGEVETPGEYQVAQGTRVKEIIEMAKPTERADLKKLNLSQKVNRQKTIKIPSKKKTVSKPL